MVQSAITNNYFPKKFITLFYAEISLFAKKTLNKIEGSISKST